MRSQGVERLMTPYPGKYERKYERSVIRSIIFPSPIFPNFLINSRRFGNFRGGGIKVGIPRRKNAKLFEYMKDIFRSIMPPVLDKMRGEVGKLKIVSRYLY